MSSKFPTLFSCSTNKKGGTVAEFYSTTGWQINCRRGLNDWEMDDICQLLQQLDSVAVEESKRDSLIWIASRDKFSVKSCYNLLQRQMGHWETDWPWKILWKTKAPVKVACFGWIATKGACLTQDNLQKRGFALSNRCYLCERDQETTNHLLLHCEISRQCWDLFLNICGVSWAMPHNVRSLLES